MIRNLSLRAKFLVLCLAFLLSFVIFISLVFYDMTQVSDKTSFIMLKNSTNSVKSELKLSVDTMAYSLGALFEGKSKKE